MSVRGIQRLATHHVVVPLLPRHSMSVCCSYIGSKHHRAASTALTSGMDEHACDGDTSGDESEAVSQPYMVKPYAVQVDTSTSKSKEARRRGAIFFKSSQCKLVDGEWFLNLMPSRNGNVRSLLASGCESVSTYQDVSNAIARTNVVSQLRKHKFTTYSALVCVGGNLDVKEVRPRQKQFIANRLKVPDTLTITTPVFYDVPPIEVKMLNRRAPWVHMKPEVMQWLADATAAQLSHGGVQKRRLAKHDIEGADVFSEPRTPSRDPEQEVTTPVEEVTTPVQGGSASSSTNAMSTTKHVKQLSLVDMFKHR